ncbi:MAG: outer membrane protein [Sulfurimonas sp.]|jgi:outer membrane protein
MIKLLLLVIPVFIYAESLKSLLDFATTNNKMVVSKNLTHMANEKSVESAQSDYYPTVDVGAYYDNLDNERTYSYPGDTFSGYATVSMDLYDGGKKSSTIKQNRELSTSSKYSSEAYKKSLQLSITQDYFNIKSNQSTLNALKDKELQLLAELDRVKKFFDVGSATIDEIDRLKAEYSDNLYQIDQIKYQIVSLKQLLSIKIGKNVYEIDNSVIDVPESIDKEKSDSILALQASANSLKHTANIISSSNMPKISVEDTFSLYAYGDYDSTHDKNKDSQNEFLVTLSMRIFDFGYISKQKESVMLKQKALQSEVEYALNEQDINIKLSTLKIETTKAQIKSAKSTLESSLSAYKSILDKYSVGAVDNVTYLDALTVRTNAKAQYETALNNLQIAYATYYYYTNKNIKEYIK